MTIFYLGGNGMVNLYELLGLTYDATENQIRQNIMQHHAAGTLDTKIIDAAKNWLLNGEIRAKYDLKLKLEQPHFFVASMFDNLRVDNVSNRNENIESISKNQSIEENISKAAVKFETKKHSNTSAFSDSEDYQYRVNKVAFCLLAFFLGGLGIHWFVAGKWKLGLCYVVLFLLFFSIWFLMWIPPLLALIDFVIGLTKKADKNGYIYYNESWFG